MITDEMIEAGARALCRHGTSFATVDETISWVDKKWPRFKEEVRLVLNAALSTVPSAGADARAEIIRIMREDFDPTPPNYDGPEWWDNAEDVADKILAVLPSPSASEAQVRVTDSFGNDLIERELVSIVLRMSRHLLAVDTPAAKKLNAGALDYLRRKGLMPSPLRAEETVVQSDALSTPEHGETPPAPETHLRGRAND